MNLSSIITVNLSCQVHYCLNRLIGVHIKINRDVLIISDADQDGAEPSGNAVAASNLVRLANFTNRPDWTIRSKQIVTTFEKLLKGIPMALPEMVIGLMTQHHPLKQVRVRTTILTVNNTKSGNVESTGQTWHCKQCINLC